MTAVTLICFRADDADPGVRTYVAVRSDEALALVAEGIANPGDAEMLPWDMLPGVKKLAAAEVGSRPLRSVAILGTTESRAWATWHPPVPPPPVPA